jgi:hypothetical protein
MAFDAKKILFLGVLWCNCLFSQTYRISGLIKSKQEALAFATVLVKGSTQGCTGNAAGYFQMPLAAGHYTLEFHYLGCQKKALAINLDKDTYVEVTLELEGVHLREVQVDAGEDPSYPIMRQAMARRTYYLDQVTSYSCRTYIKGMQKIVALPKNFDKLLKVAGGSRSDTAALKGIVYLSESESMFYYKQPRQIHEEMYSSKVSGNSQAFSFNKLSDMAINFNESLVEMPGLSDRPLISPIQAHAFMWYKFFLLDSDSSDGIKTYKIKVVPKRANDPCFRGIIYIQDRTFRLSAIDVRLNRANKINFVDTLYLKQVYAPVNDSVWMPVNLNLSFDFKVFGVSGYGFFNAYLKAYALNVSLPAPLKKNELLYISREAADKDSVYWRLNRPMPLTAEEAADYRVKDSLKIVRESTRYRDSVDKQRNAFEAVNIISGYTYSNTAKQLKITIPGILNNAIQYNTVEGIHFSYQVDIEKNYDDKRKKEFYGKVRYGFANYMWGGELGTNYYLNPKKNARIGVSVKSIVEQYNSANPISPSVNSIYTLFSNDNYEKLYKHSAVTVNYFSELMNGVYGRLYLSYARREALSNHTDMLLVDNPNRLFELNKPRYGLVNDSLSPVNDAFIADLNFLIRFDQKYYSLPDQKIVAGSKYPKLNIGYKKAIPLQACAAAYDLLSISVYDDITLGLLGKLVYRIKAGQFLTHRRLYFMDYKHFQGNQTILQSGDYVSSFRLLPYYTYSADRSYLEAHAEHNFKGALITQIPLLKKLSWQEVVGVHYLWNTVLSSNYVEVNFGMARVFKTLRVDYVLAYAANKKIRQGFTVGLSLAL